MRKGIFLIGMVSLLLVSCGPNARNNNTKDHSEDSYQPNTSNGMNANPGADGGYGPASKRGAQSKDTLGS